MKCPKCNREIYEGQNYCSKCGASLKQIENSAEISEVRKKNIEWHRWREQTAMSIVNLYLEKFPRQDGYLVKYYYSEWPNNTEFSYYYLTDEQLKVLKECSKIAEEIECSLQEILETEGHKDLLEYLAPGENPSQVDTIESIDFENTEKFVRFDVQLVEAERRLSPSNLYGVEITDEEYKELLIELMLFRNRYSMNMRAYRKPELCQKIMKNLTWATWDNVDENYNPFIVDMKELKIACESILNPFKDVIGIFNSEDKVIKDFARTYQIVPDLDDHQIYFEVNGDDAFHVLMHFEGTKVRISQEGHNVDFFGFNEILVDADDLMKAFALESPEEIFPYLKEHFGNRDCLKQLRKVLKLA